MRFDIITVLPGLLDSPFAHSILQRAQKKGLAEIRVHNLRDYASNKQKSVDDYPYGGGSGMVMQIEPFAACIEALQAERQYDEVIYMTPDGGNTEPRNSQYAFFGKKCDHPLWTLQRDRSTHTRCLCDPGNLHRRLRTLRR